MPLKIRRRGDTGSLEIYGTIRPAGEKVGFRVRVRAGSDNPDTAREEAVAYEREYLRNYHLGARPDVRSFAEAVRSYMAHEVRSVRTAKTVLRLVRYFGTLRLDQVTQEAIDNARNSIFGREVAPATIARELVAPVRAILMHAARRGWCSVPLLEGPTVGRSSTSFLLPHQVDHLIAAASPHLRPLLLFLVCTGCRLSEALALEWHSVDLAGRRVTLWEGETKSGRRRIVELVPAAVAALQGIEHRTGCVFLTARHRPYRTSEEYGGQIKTAWASACRRSGIAGIGPHVLRHSWSSWTYALNPDPLSLMRSGGWSSLALVERYAHLLPSGQEDAIRQLWGLERSRILSHRSLGNIA